MCRTSEYAQLRLLSIYKSNVKIVLTAQELFNIEGIKIDRNTVAKYFACSSIDFAFTSLSFSLDSCQSYTYLMSLDCTFLSRQWLSEVLFMKTLTYFQLINKQNCTSFCFSVIVIALSLDTSLILPVARIMIWFPMFLNTLSNFFTTRNLKCRDILLIERCFSPQGVSLSCCVECNRNPQKFCMNLKRVMSTETSRVRAINKETPFNKRN